MSDPKEGDQSNDEDIDLDMIISFAPGVVFDDDDNWAIDDSHPEIKEARKELFPHLYEEDKD